MPAYLESIITAAVDGALVLTSNKRLSRYLQAAFDRQMLVEGRTVWKTPQIYSLDGWWGRMFAELDLDWQLLESYPQKRLWELIIEEDSAGSEKELLQLSATAEKARQAAQLLAEYQVDLTPSVLTADQHVFHKWLQRYRQLCAEQGWQEQASLALQVITAIKNGRINCPEHLLLAGFDQQNPLLRKLRQQINDCGGRVTEMQVEISSTHKAHLYAAKDPQHEIIQAARWTRALLDQGVKSIGIVVTDLQSRRNQIERIFRDQIDPQAILQLKEEEAAFSLSLGSPLGTQGPIHAALEILGVGYRISLDQISFLLRTPYLQASLGEADLRASFDSKLRSFRQQSFRLSRLVELTKRANQVPVFGRCLEILAEQLKKNGRRMPGEWAAQFDVSLMQVGWPGERSLASSEFQMVKAWRDKLLAALASLDAVSRPMERTQALSLLRRLATEIEFQLEAPTGPVQVVGLLESAGLEFDHLWVMGMTEEALPAPVRPNPFLPVSLQVAQQMPHSSAERELDFACQVVTRLKAASSSVVFSYPRRDGDCELRCSPLIQHLPLSTPLFAPLADLRTQILASPTTLERLDDSQGPSLATRRGKGGTSILKDQALCPFRAFARHRLQAYRFDEAQPGLDAMTRGSLVHKVLELFWTGVESQQHLNSLTDEERTERIQQATSEALVFCFADRPEPQSGLLEIEQNRLQGLLEEWLLDLEQSRPPFQVIRLEEERLEQIGPLQIRTVIDRIDQLEDGSLIILDYKTGNVEAELLIGERLLEPQLPIYAITNTETEPAAIAFAQVRRGSCKLIGVARESGLLPKVDGVEKHKKARQQELHSWNELLQHWRCQLETLATDFVAGVARVDPVDNKHACQYCDLGGFCRITEAEGYGEQP